MHLNLDKLRSLADIYAKGNVNEFARQMQVDPSHLWRVMQTGNSGGKKMIGAVIKFCKEKGLDCWEYIVL
jgi:hypothetical protein